MIYTKRRVKALTERDYYLFNLSFLGMSKEKLLKKLKIYLIMIYQRFLCQKIQM